jgi:small subunit ribosomal protein S4
MSKYLGPRLRVVRRLGELPAFTQKVPKRKQSKTQKKPTQFYYRLVEKQKLRFYYGISEAKLISYIKIARQIKGSTGQILLRQLEIRLDNVIYRLGWAPTLFAARQLVRHGHILVDSIRVTIPSFSCGPRHVLRLNTQLIGVRSVVDNILRERSQSVPAHLSINTENITAIVNHPANPAEIPLNVNELLIIEYYSNRILGLFH